MACQHGEPSQLATWANNLDDLLNELQALAYTSDAVPAALLQYCNEDMTACLFEVAAVVEQALEPEPTSEASVATALFAEALQELPELCERVEALVADAQDAQVMFEQMPACQAQLRHDQQQRLRRMLCVTERLAEIGAVLEEA